MSCRRQRLSYLSSTRIWISLETNTALKTEPQVHVLNVLGCGFRFCFLRVCFFSFVLFFVGFSFLHSFTTKWKNQKWKHSKIYIYWSTFYSLSRYSIWHERYWNSLFNFFVLIHEVLPSEELHKKRVLCWCYISAFIAESDGKHSWGKGSMICSCNRLAAVPWSLQQGKQLTKSRTDILAKPRIKTLPL